MEDWNSAALSEALALRHKLPPLISIPPTYEWHSRVGSYLVIFFF